MGGLKRLFGLNESDVSEMANIRREFNLDVLPANVYLDETSFYKSGGHGKRIKVQKNKDKNFQPQETFSITIQDEPEVKGNVGELSQSEVNILVSFVKTYKVDLENLADQKMSLGDFLNKTGLKI